MVSRTHHGGHCCGIRHIFQFGHAGPTAQRLEEFHRELGRLRSGLLVEVVLTTRQVTRRVDGRSWAHVLQDAGFCLVNRSRNPNTGAVLNIFHRASNTRQGQITAPRFPFTKTDRLGPEKEGE